MDARERLRRYLEQRRELGETELMLDSIPVDDVMRMLGARSKTRAATVVDAAQRESLRESLREPSREPPRERADARPDSAPGDLTPAAPLPPAPPTPVTRPADPPRRITSQPVTSDWRAALTNADAGIAPAQKPEQPVAAGTPVWLTALGVPLGLQVGAASLRAHVTQLDAVIAELPSLDAIAATVAVCTRCPLHATAKNAVPGEGNPNADFVCVGEAPGQNEDEQGRPFVGAAGQLLTKILAAIKLSRDDVFICNVLKHRPPGNRDPLPNEVHACSPYLLRQLELLQPKVILALGSFAARTLLGTEEAIGKLRGRIHRYHGIPVVATYHPAALLRNEAWKRPAWEDVQLARRVYDAARAAAPATPE